ncbi:acetate/propionate family kinase, partial [Acidobacteriota bacterium]
GSIDRIGSTGEFEVSMEDGEVLREQVQCSDHGEAAELLLAWLETSSLPDPWDLDVVGHRIVHGGDRFTKPVIIDDEVLTAIESISDLAPLHNEASISAIRAARTFLGDAVPMVAVFDTAFHSGLPRMASDYALPLDLSKELGIRRYGFHGLAHQYMTERYAGMVSKAVGDSKFITLQLGNGCSAAAVAGGRSLDTSMGLTPLEGLMMGTRSGDVDPSLAIFLRRHKRMDDDAVEALLNRSSGLLGVSGRSRDMRELLEAEKRGDERASLAIEMFCYRVRKCIGSYLAVLGGADALVFGGGIGENAPEIRARICSGMDWCGLRMDEERNNETSGREGKISDEGSRLAAYVICVDESFLIAREAMRIVRDRRRIHF